MVGYPNGCSLRTCIQSVWSELSHGNFVLVILSDGGANVTKVELWEEVKRLRNL